MSRWRTIFTDSESESGVAPVCPQPDVHAMMHGVEFGGAGDPFVYDECCFAGPHIDCFDVNTAKLVAQLLTEADAEVCS